MNTDEQDVRWLQSHLPPAVTQHDAIAMRTVALARKKANERTVGPPLGPWLLTLAAACGVWMLAGSPSSAPVVGNSAWVVLEDEDSDVTADGEDEEEVALDAPPMMDVGLDDLTEDQLVSFSKHLQDPRS